MTVTPVVRALLLPLAVAMCLTSIAVAQSQEAGTVARIVVWQPKPGMSRDFEEGYKRHLQWHRNAHDTWTWHGWDIVSGNRVDYFMDGSFFHAWTDFDAPVSPAEDSANNALNVYPYADVRALATYEAIPALSNLSSQQLSERLLALCYIEVPPGRGAEFEALVSNALTEGQLGSVVHAMLRPVNGSTSYLLLLPFEKASQLAAPAQFFSQLLEKLARATKGSPIVERYHTELGLHQAELSYIPGERQ